MNSFVLRREPIQSPYKSTDKSPYKSTDKSEDVTIRMLMSLADGEKSSSAIQKELGFKNRPFFQENYLQPALAEGLIERTIPDKPNSRLQKYRLTEKGRQLLVSDKER